MPHPITVYDREKQQNFIEKVLGDTAIQRVYGTRTGRWLADAILSRHAVSGAMGFYYSSPMSRKLIPKFIQDYGIAMQEYESKEWTSFNEFFARRFIAGARPFVQDPNVMPAFAEARYFAWNEISPATQFPIKGQMLNVLRVLGSEDRARPFLGGPVLLARLCPVDYHRFHFPDAGTVKFHARIPGRLHSVNPLAVKVRPDVFFTNERQVSILETQNFGLLAYVEVGALGVGRICQTHAQNEPFSRGAEKGLFEFGASTVIVFGERGKWQPEPVLTEKTTGGTEVYVKLGTQVARRT